MQNSPYLLDMSGEFLKCLVQVAKIKCSRIAIDAQLAKIHENKVFYSNMSDKKKN